ncbi:MAG: hypothetical protein COB67_05475 [SAR324 cluster bacterium]|uniref:4Fe-4S ferredoxin-type domain-containing protein n=1 Tax=SAR324 cluster bacterium TaxID=2024889 RepID=A0A2A4T5R3_9DELT|nr:MAG: hypothetical protein COB67_05475 [SAR324 cluster bacterium]
MSQLEKVRHDLGQRFLEKKGLNLFAVFDCDALPIEITDIFDREKIAYRNYSRLLLLANGGRVFWDRLQEAEIDSSNPVDDYTIRIIDRYTRECLQGNSTQLLYPSSTGFPLQQLGELAGWGVSSPLGLEIHHDFGLWFAYRAVLLTQVKLPLRVETPTLSPCRNCQTQACIASCPAKAAHMEKTFAWQACSLNRLKLDSPCQDQCPARLACPYAVEHQYPGQQIRYHGAVSLKMIRDLYPKNLVISRGYKGG